MDLKMMSKYRNEDMPLGYVVKDPPDIKVKGIVIGNTQYTIVCDIYDCEIFDLDNAEGYSDFEVSSDEEKEEIENIQPLQIKKEPITSDNETKEKDKKHRHKKNDRDDSDSSSVSDNNKSEKGVKIKKEYEQERKKIEKSESRVKKRLVKYSPSPSPERDVEEVKVKIKEEPFDGPPRPAYLFGLYDCSICNLKMNSELTFQTHLNGKRHRKALKQKNILEAVKPSIPGFATEGQSKYPKPPPGVKRIKSKERAELQDLIETKIKTPTPGLNFVTEIRGIEDSQYYCSMCDSACSSSSIIPHLTGYKHQLKSIKQFKPGEYERMSFEPKYKIEKEIENILNAVQSKYGRGRMAVEIEKLDDDKSYGRDQPSTSRDYSSSRRDQPSTSRGYPRTSSKDPGMSFAAKYKESTIPATSSPDYYCEICQSHMNSRQMWESHTRGKRHLTNLKKMPGDRPSKTRTILLPNARAKLLDEIELIHDEPFVGLDNIQETQIPEANSQSYNCFLCGSCHTCIDIIEHLCSYKHRMKYLDYIDFPGREVVMGWSEAMGYSLVKDMCFSAEAEHGRGKPVVHTDKSALYR